MTAAPGATATATTTGPTEIHVRGAREHNLRDLDLRIPRDRLVVITGLSGSGKSSLAFDTIYAEGQRRYVESLSAYARQFLDQMTKPDVESIDGLSPAIAIEQKTASRSPRSTVGTVTEIYDFLRLLYARAGEAACWKCGRPISSQTVAQMADRVMSRGEGARAQILAPVVRGRKGAYRKELEAFRRQGFVRARIDGEMRDLADDIRLARQASHTIELVVDRVIVKESARARIVESLETATRMAAGAALVDVGDDEWLFSESNACVDCGVSYPEMAPRLFSFNSPHGACPTCNGLGTRPAFDPERVVPDPDRPLGAGAIEPWSRRRSRYYQALVGALADHFGLDLETPWRELPRRARDGILHGVKGEVAFTLPKGRRRTTVKRRWAGVLDELERRAAAGEGDELARYRSPHACEDCQGARLRAEARGVRLGGAEGLAIHELSSLSIAEAAGFLDGLELEATRRAVADRVMREIRDRLRFLADVGLDYLTLDRPSGTLSGGEAQRIRLATQVGSSLMGVLYILDEPTIGLHPRDNERLLASLERLRDAGNSVLVVEHDEATIRRADWVIDMGPGAGRHGGAVVAEGTPDDLLQCDASLTGAYLSGRRRGARPAAARSGAPVDGRADGTGGPGGALVLSGCSEHNLKDVTLRIPLGRFVVVTGVSGSGKSTLVNDTLYRALAARLHGSRQAPGRFASLRGHDLVDKVIDVNQAPIGRTPRSNPATYTGVFDGIRRLFSQVPEARVRGYGPGRFSFNVKGGRCEACSGDGLLRVEMHFLPDLFVTCEVCHGRRYNRETLEIRYKGRSIADVLDMTVSEACGFLENVPSVRRPLETLDEVGLGYLHLGQPATTLSGGEAQRIKLARELSRRATGRTLYLLDEPTTGLHFADVERLLDVLRRLVDKGNTVVVIEHHLDVVRRADWVVDLGPDGGDAGGEIVAEGPPERLAALPPGRSHTGDALREAVRA